MDLAKKLSSKQREILAQCLKITEMVFFRHFWDIFHTNKRFLWTIRMQFSHHRRNMFARKLKVFSWRSEKDRRKHHFILRILFSLLSDPLHTHIAVLTTSLWKLWKKAQNFPAQCPKMNLSLFKQFYEIFSQPKTFVCARRIQFWQPQRRCFDSRLTKISLVSENARSFFSFRNYFGLKVFFWTLGK